jgi:hypothetical protein
VSELNPAYIHIDIDGWWAIQRCYGVGEEEATPESPDRVFDEGLPALLDLFSKADIPASFFAVGADARVKAKAKRLKDLVTSGHRVENHSNWHWLDYPAHSEGELAEDISEAHEAITSATGQAPLGFRTPGYAFTLRILPTLEQLGYRYDSSILPTWAGPLFRLVDAWLAGSLPKRHQYGPVTRVFASRKPSLLKQANSAASADRSLLQLPVLSSQPLRMPLQAGVCFSRGMGALCRTLERTANQKEPIIFLLHAVDSVDTSGQRHPLPSNRGAGFFNFTAEEKISRLRMMIDLIKKHRKLTLLDAAEIERLSLSVTSQKK